MNANPQALGGGLGFRVGDIITSAGSAYRVRGFLGRGGMAQVLDVEDESLGKRFALKILDAQLATDPPSVERFEREARALAKLDHPHLVGVVRLERTTHPVPRPFFLMERLRGGTLRDHLNRGIVALDRTLTVCSDLLRALDYVHDRKLLHRDVKPSNVFVHVDAFGEERAKLLDFGVMKLLLETDACLGFFGTAHYAAPEQLEPGSTLGPPGDVYAAGIVLFETLTGTHPFPHTDRSPRGARDARRKGAPSLVDYAPPNHIPREALEELTPLVAALLARDPLARPSAGTAARALVRIGRTLATYHAENQDILSARTAVPEPFLPGHLAAPTEIDDPSIKRPTYDVRLGRTIPMPAPAPRAPPTDSVADHELGPAPPRPAKARRARPFQHTAPLPPRLDVRHNLRSLPALLPHASSLPPGKCPPEAAGVDLAIASAPAASYATTPRPSTPFVRARATPTQHSSPARLAFGSKLLFALAILAFAGVLAAAGLRQRLPRARTARATSMTYGVAAGTTSPGARVELQAL